MKLLEEKEKKTSADPHDAKSELKKPGSVAEKQELSPNSKKSNRSRKKHIHHVTQSNERTKKNWLDISVYEIRYTDPPHIRKVSKDNCTANFSSMSSIMDFLLCTTTQWSLDLSSLAISTSQNSVCKSGNHFKSLRLFLFFYSADTRRLPHI